MDPSLPCHEFFRQRLGGFVIFRTYAYFCCPRINRTIISLFKSLLEATQKHRSCLHLFQYFYLIIIRMPGRNSHDASGHRQVSLVLLRHMSIFLEPHPFFTLLHRLSRFVQLVSLVDRDAPTCSNQVLGLFHGIYYGYEFISV